MTPMNLSYSIRGRPIKPVSLVLMNTMILLGVLAILDYGILGQSAWSDALGGLAFAVAGTSFIAWFSNSQIIAEWALLGAFFVWGFRFWAIVFLYGWHSLDFEGFYLSFLWMLLAGGSWLLERSDPSVTRTFRGESWIRRLSRS